MRSNPAAILALVALLVTGAAVLGGAGESTSAEAAASSAERRGPGRLVAKDSAKQHPEAAVARAELSEFGKVSWQITSKPSGLPVENAFIVRCEKGFLFDYFPGPGDLKTKKRRAPFSGTYRIPLADPDSCDFQVAGLIPGESDKRGRVIVKIFDRG